MMDKNLVLTSGAIVFKDDKGLYVFIVKNTEEEGWELPKVIVRKGESSVRAALRMMGEKAAMTTKVLEEVGRSGGVTTVNGKILPQRHLYYLMVHKISGNEVIGFPESLWLEYSKAIKKLSSKREIGMVKSARDMYKTILRDRKSGKRTDNDDFETLEEEE